MISNDCVFIAQVEFWLNNPTTGLDYFLFDFHFPATNDPSLPLGLCAFAHNSTPPGYFNPYNPDILLPYESNAALFSGPIKLTSNILSVAEVQTLIGPDPSAKEYLLFTPNLNTDHQVYYDVTAVPSAGWPSAVPRPATSCLFRESSRSASSIHTSTGKGRAL